MLSTARLARSAKVREQSVSCAKRGSGETQACGTGAAAVAVVVGVRGRVRALDGSTPHGPSTEMCRELWRVGGAQRAQYVAGSSVAAGAKAWQRSARHVVLGVMHLSAQSRALPALWDRWTTTS